VIIPTFRVHRLPLVSQDGVGAIDALKSVTPSQAIRHPPGVSGSRGVSSISCQRGGVVGIGSGQWCRKPSVSENRIALNRQLLRTHADQTTARTADNDNLRQDGDNEELLPPTAEFASLLPASCDRRLNSVVRRSLSATRVSVLASTILRGNNGEEISRRSLHHLEILPSTNSSISRKTQLASMTSASGSNYCSRVVSLARSTAREK
jgi:hypothetical protein